MKNKACGSVVALLSAVILFQFYANHPRDIKDASQFEWVGFWHFGNGSSNVKTTDPENQLNKMEDAFIQSIPTILGGIIAGLIGYFTGLWSEQRAIRKETRDLTKSRRDELKGLIGRWQALVEDTTNEKTFPEKCVVFNESLWGYRLRFKNEIRKDITKQCEAISTAIAQQYNRKNIKSALFELEGLI